MLPERLTDQFNDHDPTDLDKEILAVLLEDGRCSPRSMDRAIDTKSGRSWINKRLTVLADTDVVEKVDRGLYELAIDPDTLDDRSGPTSTVVSDGGGDHV